MARPRITGQQTHRRAGARGGRLRAIAAIVALGILPVGAIAGTPLIAQAASAAHTTDYPSWDDVAHAQQAEDQTKTLVAQIQSQLAALKSAADAAQADAKVKGDAYGTAQDAYDTQDYKTQQLQAQVDAAQAKADAARKTAAQLASQLSKTNGGVSFTATLLAQQGDASQTLYKLEAMRQLNAQANGVYAQALQLEKSAQSLTDQANAAKAVLADLKQKAQAAFEQAQAAAEAAQTALDAQQAHEALLEAQLTVLTQKRQATQADYEAGLVAQWGPGAAGIVSSSGWAKPANGYLGDKFGMRFHPIYHVWKLHTGQDISGTGCNAPIYAAHSGTVVYAGWYSDLGNYIKIDNGDGTMTGYGHIIDGGILVKVGQHVGPGQNIARVGSTGGSTGCHLHFQVFINGSVVDPLSYMRDRGVTLG